jgi:hypothetical protein
MYVSHSLLSRQGMKLAFNSVGSLRGFSPAITVVISLRGFSASYTQPRETDTHVPRWVEYGKRVRTLSKDVVVIFLETEIDFHGENRDLFSVA